MEFKSEKMKVEIWSDLMCTYCYIGSRKFQAALADFEYTTDVEVVWRSFQIAPALKSAPEKSFYQVLMENTGMSLEEVKKASAHLKEQGQQAGLNFNFETTVPANTFRAHQLSQLAKEYGLQHAAEEQLFKAYFTEGKDLDNITALAQIGVEIGLDQDLIINSLDSAKLVAAVHADIQAAQQMGIGAVPFFLINGKHRISGAQDSLTIVNTLDKAYQEWREEQTVNAKDGLSCSTDGLC